MRRWFRPSAPPADLGRLLVCRYVALAHGHHDLVPDGCMDLLWREGGGVVLCGPDTIGWGFDAARPTPVVGIRFRPAAAPPLLRIEARELVDRQIPVADVLGGGVARRLDEQLAEAADGRARLGVLERLARDRWAPADVTVSLADAVLATAPTVEQLAEDTGLSARQVHRRFLRRVGYGPAFLARIWRLQRAARIAAARPGSALAEIAVGAGYVDQAHLAKDCRTLARMTPRQFVDALPRTSIVLPAAA